MQTAPLAHILAIVRKPFNERTQEEVHALVVLLTEQLRTFSFLTVARKKLPYAKLADAARQLRHSHVGAHTRASDEDESGLVLRVMLRGSAMVERRLGKTWLHVGFVNAGGTMGFSSLLEGTRDQNLMYTTASDCEFLTLRKFEYERHLRIYHDSAVREDAARLARLPAFGELGDAALRSLASNARRVALGAGELVVREGEASDEFFVLQSGVVRLLKAVETHASSRWPSAAAEPAAVTPASPRSPRSPHAASPRARLSSHYRRVLHAGEAVGGAAGAGSLFCIDEAMLAIRRLAAIGRAARDAAAAIEAEAAEAEADGQVVNDADTRRMAAAASSSAAREVGAQWPALRRKCTAECQSAVVGLAISPVTLIAFVQGDALRQLSRAYPSPQTGAALSAHLVRIREWEGYKQRLLVSISGERERRFNVRSFIGARPEAARRPVTAAAAGDTTIGSALEEHIDRRYTELASGPPSTASARRPVSRSTPRRIAL